MSHFSYKELDENGMETLKSIANAQRFNKWMYEAILPFCKGKILEIGSGIGNISAFFIKDSYQIVLSDIRNSYCTYLAEIFRNEVERNNIIRIDLVHPEFDKTYASWFSTFDTVFALNVLEHIKDDELAICNAKKLLRDGGNLVILVPAYPFLYNRFDKELEHFRRYTKKSLSALIAGHFHLVHTKYFNLAGIPGWFFSGKVLQNKIIPGNQMKLFNALVPFFKILDKIVGNRMGLSVIAVGRK
jgi:SAM-dependent methyltransferase